MEGYGIYKKVKVTWNEFSPGVNQARSGERTEAWHEQLKFVFGWVESVKREHEEPDLWEAIRQERTLIEAGSIESNEKFSADNQKHLREHRSIRRSCR